RLQRRADLLRARIVDEHDLAIIAGIERLQPEYLEWMRAQPAPLDGLFEETAERIAAQHTDVERRIRRSERAGRPVHERGQLVEVGGLHRVFERDIRLRR